MSKTISFLLVTVIFLAAANIKQTQSYSITDNGTGSSNSVKVNINDESTVQQSNTADINNTANQNANTGGNSGSAVTGDATSITNINNSGNINLTDDPCCVTPDPGNPNATPTGVNGGNGGTDIGNGGGSSTSTGSSASGDGSGTGGGEVLGLSQTSGTGYDTLIRTITGILCLTAGSLIIRKKPLSV